MVHLTGIDGSGPPPHEIHSGSLLLSFVPNVNVHPDPILSDQPGL